MSYAIRAFFYAAIEPMARPRARHMPAWGTLPIFLTSTWTTSPGWPLS
ncbi:MAG: hypothetical protein M3024_07275 [Candidatus Dormibacteraeota bacterium]|nr:hypothetical protein [Candidatus Dormibacteraeota bacterium]